MNAQVLVVDDEAAVRTTEAEILRGAGYDVVEACDGNEALEVLKAGKVGAVVLDVRMPGRDGIAVLSALDDPPPVVLVSAHACDERDLAQVAGKVMVLLHKPVPPRHLLDQVRLALGRGEDT